MVERSPPSDIERDIDENLRRVYQRRLKEDLPDRFEELLRRLREEQDEDPSEGGA